MFDFINKIFGGRSSHDEHHDCGCGCGGNCGGANADSPNNDALAGATDSLLPKAKSATLDEAKSEDTSQVGVFLPTWLVVVVVIGGLVLVYFRFVHRHLFPNV